MTKKLIGSIFFFVIIAVTAQAQDKGIDSLKNILTTVKSDSIKARVLSSLSYRLMTISFEESQKYADQLLTLANKMQNSRTLSTAYSRQGYLATFRGDHRAALEFDSKNLNNRLKANDSARLTAVYNDVGNDYLELEKFEEAYFYVKKSLELANAKSDTANASIAEHNLAVIYYKLGSMDVALQYFALSAKHSLAMKDYDAPAYDNFELGNAYFSVKNYKEAERYLLTAIRQSKERDVAIVTPRIYQSIANLFLSKKDYVKSSLYYDSASVGYKRTLNEFGEAQVELGRCRLQIEQKNYKEAEKIASNSLAVALKLGAQKLQVDCYHLLSLILELQSEFKKALEYNKLEEAAHDSLISVNVMSQVFENEFQMRSQKKDEEIASLTKQSEQSASELKRQEFLRNIFAVVFALTIVLLYTVYKSGRRKVEMNDLLLQHQAEIEKRTQELEELNKVKDKFFSIISHDLRSPINSLAGLLDLMEKDQIKAEELPALTVEMRTQFNHTKNLINNLLDWTLLQMNKVSIRKEKINMRSLIDGNIKLLSAMSTKKMNFTNSVDDDSYAFADQNMINLVFRNLILNGIKFTDNGGTIKMTAEKNQDSLVIKVTDSGVGIEPEIQKVLFDKTTGYSTRGTANEKGTGLGLILCKEFVERNNGKIWLESTVGKGTTFFVSLPIA